VEQGASIQNGAKTVSMTTLNILPPSIECHYAERHIFYVTPSVATLNILMLCFYAECFVLNVIMLSIFMLTADMVSFNMLNIALLSIIVSLKCFL
jgi:hypothetical protein